MVMTKQEAFEFLELEDSASVNEIKQRIADKLLYFEELSEKAPSDFLRRLNMQKLNKVKAIQQQAAEWYAAEPVLQEDSFVNDNSLPSIDTDNEMHAGTTPIIVASGGRSTRRSKNNEPQPTAWLVLHTENQEIRTYPLYPGKNYIGRKQHPTLKPFLLIDEDPYISRVHAVIEVEDGNPYDYYITDSTFSNKVGVSKNGTYINGDEARITKKTKLIKNDTIQIGVTKLVLKYNDKHIKQIIEEVGDTRYVNTVKIDI